MCLQVYGSPSPAVLAAAVHPAPSERIRTRVLRAQRAKSIALAEELLENGWA